MRAFIVATLLAAPLCFGAALAQTSAPAAAAHYTTAGTNIGTLLDDPDARAVIDKHIPGFSSQAQIDMARSLTLKGIQQYAPDKYTDQVLADIDADLAKLPAKK
ncbi:MAG TPA: hypothetical protein VNZ06_05160 [Steroidobacteraceae bacterium]|nr:hypothetical protein [Steroidobacteraceae bacterium]